MHFFVQEESAHKHAVLPVDDGSGRAALIEFRSSPMR